jgi:hypothetical protein
MKITRQVITKTLTLGSPETIQLPRNFCTRNLVLRLNGTADISTAAAGSAAKAAGAANILQNIRVRLDGRETVYSLPGALTYEMNKLLYGRPGAITNPATATATNVAISCELIIPFENIGGVKEFDTLINASKLQSSFDLVIDTQGAANCFNGTVTAAVNSAFTLEVCTNESVGVNNFVFGTIRQYMAQKVSVAGTSSNFQIKPLPVGNMIKGIMVFAEDTYTYNGSNTLINNIKLKSGTDVFVDRPFTALKAEYEQKAQIATGSTGVCYIDFMEDGSLNQCLDLTDATGRRTFEAELDVTVGTSNNIYMVVLEYVPPTIVKQA